MNRLVKLCILLVVIMSLQLFLPCTVRAASCSGSSCEDLNPNTMGCSSDAVTAGSAKYLSDGSSTTETRYSSACNAKWTRTQNNSGGNRYAAGSLRYGCADYCYDKSISSPAKIASGSVVYTMMLSNVYTPPTRSCGSVNKSGPISIPISVSNSKCTGQN